MAADAASDRDDFVELCEEPLQPQKYTDLVVVPEAGAVSTFVGTTRDSFEGKV